ncbi:glycosyltransferase family 4 protein [Arenicella chitinivorans]|uniref:glycosyltransferase family 4 protein n=1 Tax=Arenicella chitinivorans TaxID=1329800 RepID=UPI00227D8B9C|nr:glycosyltransferase family 1 protein [Arenicella chitinivorans]
MRVGSSWVWHLVVPLWLLEDKPALFWSPRQHLPIWMPSSTKSVVTVHDLVWKTHPKTMPFLQRLSERVWMPSSVKKSDAIIAVSQTTRSTLEDSLPYSNGKVCVIKHASLVKRSADYSSCVHQDRNHFLAVGTLEPRKNYVRLIRAFNLYSRSGGQKDLVIVGRDGWKTAAMYRELDDSPYRERIHVMHDVTDQKLVELYTKAFCLVSTSLDEGFGLPLLEARAFGLPLCISAIPIYQELFADAEVWFDPKSVHQIADSFQKISSCRCEYVPRFNSTSGSKDLERCRAEHRNLFLKVLGEVNDRGVLIDS